VRRATVTVLAFFALFTGAAHAGRSKALKIYDAAKAVSRQHRSYLFGGGHGLPLPDLKTGRAALDCSGSVSLVLYKAGVFGRYAWTSGAIAAGWGRSGRGKWVTVFANSGHVWIKFDSLGKWVRFDTSSWGSGGDGPRVRSTERPQSGFVPRHAPGT